MIDKEINSGINPDNIFVCGFSQGGACLFISSFLRTIETCTQNLIVIVWGTYTVGSIFVGSLP